MPTLQSHTIASSTNRHTCQSLQKSVPVPPQKEFQNIFSSPFKKIKTPDTQTDTTKTLKRSADNGLQGRPSRTSAGNTGLVKVAVHSSADPDVSGWLIIHEGALSINICNKNHCTQVAKIKNYYLHQSYEY